MPQPTRKPWKYGMIRRTRVSDPSQSKAIVLTVDGSEIRRSPVEVGIFRLLTRVLYISSGAGFLPSTV